MRYWRQQQFASQFLIYGKISKNEEFKWEVVPQFECSSRVTRLTQQWITLCGDSFPKKSNGRCDPDWIADEHEECELFSDDPFCNNSMIEKQWVYEGESIYILYNYRPIEIGNDKLHFLVVPKKHRPTFYQLSEDEYQEALVTVQKLCNYFFQARMIREVHLFHKSGIDAGQTVPHWHMHVVLTTSDLQTCLGKLSILRNMLFTPSPLADDELEEKVTQYRNELIPALHY